MRKIKPLIWLHAIRVRRYLLSILSGSVTDSIWMAVFLIGAYSSQGPTYAREVFWALAAWSIVANAGWMIGGWIDYLSELGLLEPLDFSGVSPVVAAASRSFVIAIPTGLSSLITLLISFQLGFNPLEISSPWLLALSLLILWTQATAYGAILASTVLLTSVPSALLDIAALAYLGLLLANYPAGNLQTFAFLPLLGPGYVARQCVSGNPPLGVFLAVTVTTIVLSLFAISYSRSVEKLVKKRAGYRAIALH
ncbi:MAG: hypothetical protein ACP5PL_04790 [Infirmifilum sp.]